MTEIEEPNAARSDSENRGGFSFLSRDKSTESTSSGSGNSGGNSDGSRIGESGKSGSGSDTNTSGSGESGGEVTEESSSATGGDSESSSSAGSGSGRDSDGERKLHVKFTRKCGYCVARNSACGKEIGTVESATKNTGEKKRRIAQENVPEFVDWGDLFPGMAEGKTPKVDDLLSLAYVTCFDVVKYARKEDHWAISKAEAAKLGKVTVACINTIPEAVKSKVIKKFDKYLPWVSLIAFAAVISYPRIQMSIEIEKQKKSERFARPLPFPNVEKVATNPNVERNAPATVPGGIGESVKSNFPPGHGANFPPLDYEIPS